VCILYIWLTCGEITMPAYINNHTYVEVQWSGFVSKVDIMMYYVAMSNNTDAMNTSCILYVSAMKHSPTHTHQYKHTQSHSIHKCMSLLYTCAVTTYITYITNIITRTTPTAVTEIQCSLCALVLLNMSLQKCLRFELNLG
jgi:hypothetical protein